VVPALVAEWEVAEAFEEVVASTTEQAEASVVEGQSTVWLVGCIKPLLDEIASEATWSFPRAMTPR
jgi:hypothetical protein